MVNTGGNIIKQRNGRHFHERFVNPKQSRRTIKTYFLPTKLVNTTKLSSKFKPYQQEFQKICIHAGVKNVHRNRHRVLDETEGTRNTGKVAPEKKEPFHLTFASSNSKIGTLENIDIVIDIVLVSLLLNANIFYNFFQCLYC